jgi:hypothetical protein
LPRSPEDEEAETKSQQETKSAKKKELPSSSAFLGLDLLLVGVDVLGLDLPGEDQGEPWAWELGHGHSGRRGWAGKPPSQAVYPVDCRPLAGTQGRVHSRAHTLRSMSFLVAAAAGDCCLGVVVGLADDLVLLVVLDPRIDPENGGFGDFVGVFLVQSPTMGSRR